MFDFLNNLFDTSGFPARWHCGHWSTGHGWLHILSDLGVWLAYLAIPCVLGYFALRRKDIPFRSIFLLFGAFILACGTTHLMEALIFWWPAYRLAGVIKLFTALVSWGTVIALIPVVPKVLAMRSPEELEREVAARRQAEDELRRANAELERRVEERTTELTQSVIALRDEKEWFRTTLASIGDAVITTDTEGKVTLLNPVAESLTGWSLEGAYGLPLGNVFNILHEESRQPVESPVVRALQDGRTGGLSNHILLIAKDGAERPVEDNAAPIRHKNGTVAGVVLVFRDTTERRRSEQAERKNQEIMQLVHKIGKIGHWEWNLLTNENKWSPEIEALYGLPPGGFEGGYDGWARLIHPEDLPKVDADMKRALDTGEYFTEFRVIWPDRSIHWLETRAKVLKDAHDKPVRIMGVNMDITERKKQEEALRASEQHLREADRRKDEFLATLAHELRNPLATIRNGLQVMHMANGNRDTVELARSMMDRQFAQFVRLVDDLMDVSRISRGKIELRKERVELAAVVHSAVETSRPLIEQMGHELTVSLPEFPVILDADLTRLAQVFLNLLHNAAKYTERGGHIWLSAEVLGSTVVVTVKDNGIGIAAGDLPRLFTMFSQLTNSLERAQGGLGIGLTLVKTLVEKHNGTVEARSEGLGKGSKFVVRLPIAAERFDQHRNGDAFNPARVPPSRSGYRLLVVDDNQDAANSLAMLLELQGHEVRVAYSGMAALEMTKTYTPEAVFMDIGMPGMDGNETARRMREQPGLGNVVLAALTGWGQIEDRRRTAEVGFNHHLVKPPEPKALEDVLAALRRVNMRK